MNDRVRIGRCTVLAVAIAGLLPVSATGSENAARYQKIVIPQMDTSALNVIGTRLHMEIMRDVTTDIIHSRKFDSVYADFRIRNWKEASSRVKREALPLPVRDTTIGATAELRVGLVSADTLEYRKKGCRIRLNFEARVVDHISGQGLISETVQLTYDEAWGHDSGRAVATGAVVGGLLGALIADAVVPEGKVRDIRNTFKTSIVRMVTVEFAKRVRDGSSGAR